MRFQTKMILVLAAIFICLVALGGIAAAQGFSADVVNHQGIQSRIYVTKDMMRHESGGLVSITRLDRNVVWQLMPIQKMYMERELGNDSVIPNAERCANELERTSLGNETVNGVLTNKYRLIVKNEKVKVAVLLWLAADTQLPVKMAAEDGRWSYVYRNVIAGEPSAILFDLPANYAKFSMTW